MKSWLNRYMSLFLICILFFTSFGCTHEKKVYESTPEQLIAEFRNYFINSTKKYTDSIVIVEGIVSVIVYPKDGFFLDECIMYLGGVEYDNKRRTGDHVSCQMKHSEPKTYIGNKIKIKGKFAEADLLRNELYISLKDCEKEKEKEKEKE